MKNLFSTLILSLLALGCTQQQPESLRLATFNIRYNMLDQLITNSLKLKWYKSLILPLFLR